MQLNVKALRPLDSKSADSKWAFHSLDVQFHLNLRPWHLDRSSLAPYHCPP